MSLRLYRFDISSVQLQATIVRASSEQEARCLVLMAAAGDSMAQTRVFSEETRTLGGLREHPVQSISNQEHQYDIGYWENPEVQLVNADIELEFGRDHNHG